MPLVRFLNVSASAELHRVNFCFLKEKQRCGAGPRWVFRSGAEASPAAPAGKTRRPPSGPSSRELLPPRPANSDPRALSLLCSGVEGWLVARRAGQVISPARDKIPQEGRVSLVPGPQGTRQRAVPRRGRPLNSWASEAGAASGPQRTGGVPSPAPPANQDPRGPCPASGFASSRRQPWVSAQRRETRGARPPSPAAPRVRAPAARTGLMARAGAPGGGRGPRPAVRSLLLRQPSACLSGSGGGAALNVRPAPPRPSSGLRVRRAWAGWAVRSRAPTCRAPRPEESPRPPFSSRPHCSSVGIAAPGVPAVRSPG